MRDIRARILSNREIVSGYFKMNIETPFIARNAKPGQFVMVKCSTDGQDPLLRRPFSIHKVKGRRPQAEGIEILYKVVGKGTEILSKKRKGEFIDILGPLGNGFKLPPTTYHLPSSTFLIAGGIGVAPFVFLAEELARRKIETVVLLGARTKKTIFCEKDFRKMQAKLYITTDDGTYGYKGLVSELFEKILPTMDNGRHIIVYACGSLPMLQCISRICKGNRIQCQFSFEEKMACGIGACLGCVVKIKSKRGFIYKLVCKDGPIFDIEQIIWP